MDSQAEFSPDNRYDPANSEDFRLFAWGGSKYKYFSDRFYDETQLRQIQPTMEQTTNSGIILFNLVEIFWTLGSKCGGSLAASKNMGKISFKAEIKGKS